MYMAHFYTLNKRLKECHNDKALLETYFRTTAGEIRAKIKRRKERLQNMTVRQKQQARQMRMRQKEQARQMRMKAAEENAAFLAAQKKEPGLTLGEFKADLFLQDLAEADRRSEAERRAEAERKAEAERRASAARANALDNPTPSEHKEGEELPVTASEHKATAGGRKTRRKRRRKKKKSRRKRKTHRRRKRRKTRKRRR